MERRKRIIIISVSALAAALIAVLCIAVTAARKSAGADTMGGGQATTLPSDADMYAPVNGSLTVSVGEDVLFSTLEPRTSSPVFAAGVTLTVRCDIPGAKAALLLDRADGSGGGERIELSFADGECSVDTSYFDGEYACSVLLGEVLYAASANALLGGYADAVEMISDISTAEDAAFSKPFSWITNGFTFSTEGALTFVSDVEGEMKIINGADEIRCGRLFCDAPGWDFTVSAPFGGFEEARPFSVYARTVNGRRIDCGEVYVDTEDDWRAIFPGGRLDVPQHVERLVCEGNFTVEGGTAARPLSLSFSGGVEIGVKLIIETAEAADISVDCGGNESALAEKIRFDAPACSIFWTGGEPELEYVERYMNVREYNGAPTDPNMGGSGTVEVMGGYVVAGERSVGITVEGNVMSARVGYADNIADIGRAEIKAELSGEGEGELYSLGDAYYFKVTDGNGGERGYKVELSRPDYSLPVVNITTDGGAPIESKDTYIGGTFSIDYNGAFDYDGIEDARIGIRGRGNSSWKLEKKPYKIKFESGVRLFGLQKAKKWVLIANHVDRSLIRNRLAYSIAGVLDNFAFVPSAYIVDVFVNGEYAGVYQISEQVEINDGRVPGEEDSTEIDTDYLLEIGGEKTKTSFGYANFSHELFKYVQIKAPDEDVLSKKQYKYISSYIKSVEDAIIEGGDYEALLDVDSLVDWFLLYEFAYNADGIFRRSDFLLKEKGGKLIFCTPWDFDYAFGNFMLDSESFSEWISLGTPLTDKYDKYIADNIMKYLLRDETFIARVKARWAEVGGSMLKTGLETVDDAEKNVSPSAAENFKRWDILGKKLSLENDKTAAIDTYAGQLEYLRAYMKNRFEWMDRAIGAL